MSPRTCFWMLALVLLPGEATVAHAASPNAELENYRGVTITEIQTQGIRVTRNYVIAREIWSEEGQPLDPQLVANDIVRLENLALFGSVVVTVIPMDEGVALNFEFTEMPSLIPFPAVSWNEQNGFSFGVGLTSPNFRGKGVNLSTKAVFGGTTNYYFRASNPWVSGDHLSVELLAYHSERQNTVLEYGENSDRAEVTLGYYIGRYGRMSGNIGYWSVESDRDGITLDPSRRDRLFLAGMKVGFDNRDSWRVPHSGWEAELVSSSLGGDANTQTSTLDVRRYQPVADRQTLVIGPLFSMQTGVVGTHIPSYQQYFLGGSNSVRGYKLQELGKELFGRNRLLFTTEYRYLVMPVRAIPVLNWSVAVGMELAAFGDVGIVWNDPEEFGFERTRLGYGIGARVLFPVVEMLRFDVGISEFGDVVFNFGIRSMFEARSLPIY